MAGPHTVPKLAARRPDWQLPELHSGLQLAPLDVLYNNKERIRCPKCGRSRAHYCYDCLEALVPFPRVELPFRVSIVTHHEEKASKNTGVQVAILAAGQVDLHTMSQVPSDVDPSRCAVLFPSDNALEVEQLEPDSIDRLFIIDSRWKKAGELIRTATFQAMRAVRLSETRSAFWRFHTRGVAEEGVCTVEALYFCLEAMAKKGKLTDPRFTAPHAFDNLLWYFVYQHQVVQQAAQKRLQERGAQGPGPVQGDGSGPIDNEVATTTDNQQHQQQQATANGGNKHQGLQQKQEQQKPQKHQGQQKQKQKHKHQPGAEASMVPTAAAAGANGDADLLQPPAAAAQAASGCSRGEAGNGVQQREQQPPSCSGAAPVQGDARGEQRPDAALGIPADDLAGAEAAQSDQKEGGGAGAAAANATAVAASGTSTAHRGASGEGDAAEDAEEDNTGHRLKRARI